MLNYIDEGGFLDSQTEEVMPNNVLRILFVPSERNDIIFRLQLNKPMFMQVWVDLVTFNPNFNIIGLFRIKFQWQVKTSFRFLPLCFTI